MSGTHTLRDKVLESLQASEHGKGKGRLSIGGVALLGTASLGHKAPSFLP